MDTKSTSAMDLEFQGSLEKREYENENEWDLFALVVLILVH